MISRYIYYRYTRYIISSGFPGRGPSRQTGVQERSGGCTDGGEVHDGGDAERVLGMVSFFGEFQGM